MKILGIATAVVAIGITLGPAPSASAEPVTVSQDPTTVKMVCGKYGGVYGPPDENGGAVCLLPDGGFIQCDKNNNCTHYPPGRPNAPMPIRPGSNGQVG